MITLSQMNGKKGKCRAHDPSKCRFHAGCHKENGGESAFEFPSWIDEDVFPMENWKRYFDLALPHFNAIRENECKTNEDDSFMNYHIEEIAKHIGVLFGLGEKQSHVELGTCDFGGSKVAEETFLRAIDFFERMCPQKVMSNKPLNFKYVNDGFNSSYSPNTNTCLLKETSFSSIAHEIAHHIELNNTPIHYACEDYLDLRCGDEKSHVLYVEPDGEVVIGREDKFYHPYTGRDYLVNVIQGKKSPKIRVMTEILSTGIQFATHEPFLMYKKDKDLFAFTVSALKGDMS